MGRSIEGQHIAAADLGFFLSYPAAIKERELVQLIVQDDVELGFSPVILAEQCQESPAKVYSI